MKILGWVCGLLAFSFLGLIYWSSIIQEEDLKHLRLEIRELKTSIQDLRFTASRQVSSVVDESKYPFMDPSLPNLLEEDTYYTKTLPAQLGEDFRPRGMRRQALLGRPEHLHPFNPFRDVTTMINMCSVSVAQLQFGKYETLSPFAAIKMEERPLSDAPTAYEYWVFLRDDLYWEPLKPEHFPSGFKLDPHFLQRHQVTAHDFKFFHDAVMNPGVSEPKAASLRNYYGDIEEIRVVDDLTFVVRWKTQLKEDALGKGVPKVKYMAKGLTGNLQPLPCFVYQYFADGKKIIDDDSHPDTYRINSVWAQNFAEHWAKNVIVSCGGWVFDGINDEGVRFKRNPDFFSPYAVLVERAEYLFKESIDAIWQDFKAGKIDLCTLAPSQIPELDLFLNSHTYLQQKEKGKGIEELDYVDLAYYYLGWNQETLFFNTPKVRKAMTMAIDRNRIIRQNLNDMGIAITGPFFRYSPAYDPTIEAWPYNPDETRRLLDEAGWIDLDGDGIRDKMIEGKRIPFRFTLSYFAKNVSTRVICEYISTTLREVGVDCQLSGVDITDLARSFEDKSFDAIYMGWGLGTPPDDPRQLWHSSGAKEKGSSNAVGFAHPEADRLIETLQYEYDREKRKEFYHNFHKIIHKEAPYTFFYSPKTRLLYREYVKNLFIPRDRQDLVPGADISEPDLRVIWLDT